MAKYVRFFDNLLPHKRGPNPAETVGNCPLDSCVTGTHNVMHIGNDVLGRRLRILAACNN